MSKNLVILIGNVGKDPEIHTFDNGNKIAKFTLATNETFKNKQGEKATNTEWHNIVIGGKSADAIETYVKKGVQLYIEGKIQYKSYEKDGVKKYFTQILGYSFNFLGSKQETTTKQSDEPEGENQTDDLPF